MMRMQVGIGLRLLDDLLSALGHPRRGRRPRPRYRRAEALLGEGAAEARAEGPDDMAGDQVSSPPCTRPAAMARG